MSHLRRFRRQMGKTSKNGTSSFSKPDDPERVDLEMSELEAILARVRSNMTAEEYERPDLDSDIPVSGSRSGS